MARYRLSGSGYWDRRRGCISCSIITTCCTSPTFSYFTLWCSADPTTSACVTAHTERITITFNRAKYGESNFVSRRTYSSVTFNFITATTASTSSNHAAGIPISKYRSGYGPCQSSSWCYETTASVCRSSSSAGRLSTSTNSSAADSTNGSSTAECPCCFRP